MDEKLVKLRLIIFACLLLITVIFVNGHPKRLDEPAITEFETRCGWFSNPTPGNIWLYDKEGEWTIGVQGGYQVEDDWKWPDFKAGQWVQTNAGDYGYGCACLRLQVNKQTHEVTKIESSRARPLAACRQDRSLRRWRQMLR